MTKYILHGGFTGTNNELNRTFYQELVKDVKDGGNILLVYFAREDEVAPDLFKEDKERILKYTKRNDLNLIVATQDNFAKQVKSADAIYIRGGQTEKLLSVLEKHPTFKDDIKGKTVAGSSAGAYVLSTYNHSASRGGVHKGLGILKVKVVCHYSSDRFDVGTEAVEQMKQYPDDLELVVLKDFEWKVFEI